MTADDVRDTLARHRQTLRAAKTPAQLARATGALLDELINESLDGLKQAGADDIDLRRAHDELVRQKREVLDGLPPRVVH